MQNMNVTGNAHLVAALRGGPFDSTLGGERGAGHYLPGAARGLLPWTLPARPGLRHMAQHMHQVLCTRM